VTQQLPPLNALRAFDAVARHGSITRAAAELCVTPGAITKQIQLLEEFLGVDLFLRGHREIVINSKGEQYHRAISQALMDIQGATEKIKAGSKEHVLKIRSYTTFSIRWLIPHAAKFLAANPDISLELTTSLEPIDFAREEIDCAIRMGNAEWPNMNATKLIDNVIIPVCSPKYLAGKKITKPKDLLSHKLLHIKRRPHDWSYWLTGNGLGSEPIPEGMICENSEFAYSAAKEGLGIVMAQYFLVHEDLEAGRLVRPVEQTHDCGANSYYLITPSQKKESIHTKKFKEWILNEIKASKDKP
jgi:LysR family glycine cleavage system transcriptional activator